jgi:lipoate-protein ligase A
MDVARRDMGGGCIYFDAYPGTGLEPIFVLDKKELPTIREAGEFLLNALGVGVEAMKAQDAEVVGSGDLRWHGRKMGSFTLDLLENAGYTIGGGPFFCFAMPNMEMYMKTAVVPPEKMKDKEITDPSKYMAPLYEVIGKEIPYEDVRHAYVKEVEKFFDVKLVPGRLSLKEYEDTSKILERQRSDEWLHRKSSSRFQERAPSGCKVGFATEKYKKLVRIGVAVEPATHEIKGAMIAGDMYVSPYTAIEDMENGLKGVDARNEQEQLERIKRILLRPDVEQADFHRINSEEFLSTLRKAIDNAA